MDYNEALQYMKEAGRRGSIPGLTNIKNLLNELNNPQEELRFIHISGTNGKGSTLAFISTILEEAGYKTGRFISPIVNNYEEQFQINGKSISKDNVTKYINRIDDIVKNMEKKGMDKPTVFEIETAIAFTYFNDEKCDIVTLETGMGGLLDATNIIPSPVLTLIAPISMDHMNFLGNTLSEIAKHKAGIIKPGTYVVSAPQPDEALSAIKEKCDNTKVNLKIVSEDDIKNVRYSIERTVFDYKEYKNLTIQMLGFYQPANAELALEGIHTLNNNGYRISKEAIMTGLSKAQWMGRFQILRRKPLFVIDGAHNESGARALADSIKFYFTNKRIIYIMGVLRDKEYDKIIKVMMPLASKVFTVTPNSDRALCGNELSHKIEKYGYKALYCDTIADAVNRALNEADREDVIVSFGSLSYLGEIFKIINRKSI
ncbi:MAG: bifunctional folylpolyglutamate synthase/dihydrofolate synthase [Suipraeoptans sp.]